ncbi:NADPH-dependent 2,4-dienoyl-CoA reductase/sulfur reductase-like enzyme [Methylorubrum rhodinum]|uniref:NADPH-dependent 2,4-dienoyl-CoA reductase/sulfur reductase-like enzyme n=1 Tax=Methylorubrum rhodinum TaxID=29428 RepID=A0A840ZE49_9HYPH|nr:NAD(P)/FAD-dependent oxidoreductase [Methylorubrum rhodinum]MBB5755331.1 NADPH-dependent 2,4-dienoyl-CoA reductase/sulfur reductase-like enzyme [Methylorubrum rhodinum]
MSAGPTRRGLLAGLTAASLSTRALAAPALARAAPRVIVVGGGFGGTAAARALVRSGIAATLIEPSTLYATCPSSNAVIAGLMPMSAITFGYDGVRRAGVTVVHDTVTAIDADARRIGLAGGQSLAYDRLVVSAGIGLRFDAIPGYDAAASATIPHAWKAGAQTALLARQIAAMEDGGLVVLTVPALPYRCPPGPYERAGLIAHVLKTRKPRSKVIVLDAKDSFSKQPLFQAAWTALYPDHIEWVPLGKGGRLDSVDAAARTLRAEAGLFRPAVINVVPPQTAPRLCIEAGLANAGDWCPVDPITFESALRPGIHVIGDAAAAGAMPKSAFSAFAQAQVCAGAVADLLAGRAPPEPKLINVCYSLAAPDYGFSIAGVYRPEWDRLVTVPGSDGLSPEDASPALRAREADLGRAWFAGMTRQLFG